MVWAASLAGGVLVALPFLASSCAWLVPLAPVPWLVLLSDPDEPAPLRPVAAGAVLFMALALSWLWHVAPPIWAFASAYYATSVIAFAWAYRRCRMSFRLPAALLAPPLWVAAEVLRLEVYPFGVQWLNVGIPLVRFTLPAQVVELFGAPGLSVVVLVIAGGIADAVLAARSGGRAQLVRPRTWAGVAAGLVLWCACAGYGALRIRGAQWRDERAVALIQAAVPQHVRNQPGSIEGVFARHAELTRSVATEDVALVAWSESAMQVFFEDDDRWSSEARSLARSIGRPLLLGAIGLARLPEGDIAPTNSAYLIDEFGTVVERWDKRVLVPPAETLLWIDRWAAMRRRIGAFLHETMHFTPFIIPGKEARVKHLGGEPGFGVMICYDDAVPRPSLELHAAGADVLVVLTNEAWFGSAELGQHLNIARLRTIETRLPMVRIGNTGITAAIDSAGRIQASLPRDVPGALVVRPRTASLEPPAPWLPAAFRRGVLLLGAGLAAGAWMTTRARSEPPPDRARGARRRSQPARRESELADARR